ncbi:MAG: hypothetical protein MI757_20820, partial [Pirellulales bacterium]|nr:hypothetical protein [Pirellulales bacterium]
MSNLLRSSSIALIASLACLPAKAEHRVALLIDNSQHQDKELATPARDLKKLQAGLERFGFRCSAERGLDEVALRTKIASFAESTPTAGTAMIYFSGPVMPGKTKNETGTALLGVNSAKGRGHVIPLVVKAMHEKGGSNTNLLVVDSSAPKTANESVPPQSLLAYADHTSFVKKVNQSDDLIAA